MSRIISIGGPTATGKTELAANIANRLKCDVVSVDSRQAYQGMDIGTGKDIPKGHSFKVVSTISEDDQTYTIGFYEINGVKFWLYDMVNPLQLLNSAMYRQAYLSIVNMSHQEEKVSILVGGTGFYLKTILNPPATLTIKPNLELREKLGTLKIQDLQSQLKQLNPDRLSVMNNSDKNNPRRLIRAIEVASSKSVQSIPKANNRSCLKLGLKAALPALLLNIESRVHQRVQSGFIEEVEMLMKKYPSFMSKPSGKTLGYAQMVSYLKGDISKQTAISEWILKEGQYAKRQLTWFNQQNDMHWFDITQKKWRHQADELIDKWMDDTSAINLDQN